MTTTDATLDKSTTSAKSTTSTTSTKIGWVLTALISLFLLFDGVIHLLNVDQVQKSMADLGYPSGIATGIGAVELVLLALYLVPRTAPLGAVLLTGYLGGAVSAQLRIEAPLFSTALFAVYVGIVLWVGLYLRDSRFRALVKQALS